MIELDEECLVLVDSYIELDGVKRKLFLKLLVSKMNENELDLLLKLVSLQRDTPLEQIKCENIILFGSYKSDNLTKKSFNSNDAIKIDNEIINEDNFEFSEVSDIQGNVDFKCEQCGEQFCACSDRIVEKHFSDLSEVKKGKLQRVKHLTFELNSKDDGNQVTSKEDVEDVDDIGVKRNFHIYEHKELQGIGEKEEEKIVTSISPNALLQEKKDFLCIACLEQFSTYKALKGHIKNHRKKFVKCGQPSEKFCPSKECLEHSQENKCSQTFMCSLCPMVFRKKWNLKKHMERKHSNSGEKEFTCEVCPKSFSNKRGMNKHMKTHHCPIKCEICPKTFINKGRLNEHIKTHIGQKPFLCDQCSKSFRSSSNLNTHKKSHSEERPIKCDQCVQTFKHNFVFKRHQMMHSGERPFKCEQCTMAFATKEYLKQHTFVHTVERPHKCKICPKTYKTRTGLLIHQKVHDKIDREIRQPGRPEGPKLCDLRTKKGIVEENT